MKILDLNNPIELAIFTARMNKANSDLSAAMETYYALNDAQLAIEKDLPSKEIKKLTSVATESFNSHVGQEIDCNVEQALEAVGEDVLRHTKDVFKLAGQLVAAKFAFMTLQRSRIKTIIGKLNEMKISDKELAAAWNDSTAAKAGGLKVNLETLQATADMLSACWDYDVINPLQHNAKSKWIKNNSLFKTLPKKSTLIGPSMGRLGLEFKKSDGKVPNVYIKAETKAKSAKAPKLKELIEFAEGVAELTERETENVNKRRLANILAFNANNVVATWSVFTKKQRSFRYDYERILYITTIVVNRHVYMVKTTLDVLDSIIKKLK